MTQDEIIEMARQAGLSVGVALDGSKSMGKHEDKSFAVGRLPLDDFVSFVQLVAAKERTWWESQIKIDVATVKKEEREACAKVCEDRQEAWRKAGFWKDVHEFREMAFYIRARGEA